MTAQDDHQPNAGIRIGSMLLDHFIMTFVVGIFFLPGMVSGFSAAFEINHEPANPDIFAGLSYIGLIGFALYFCKDCLNGRSIAKRALKLQVVENSSGRAAPPLKTLIRNLFCIIWPVEVIMTLVNPGRRLGDMVAGTKVVRFDAKVEQSKPKLVQTGFSLLLAFGMMALLMLPYQGLKSKMAAQKFTCIESSLNETEARAAEQLFADSLGNYLTADVRVYDQLKEDKRLKYVSVILKLKENYLDNDIDFEQIKSATLPLLLKKFPEETFVGQIKYVYQQPGSIQIRTLPLDWRQKN